MSCATLKVSRAETLVVDATVGMTQIALLAPEGVGRAILGSCVGLVLFDPQKRLAAMAHIVLPRSDGRVPIAGKFADTAVESMTDSLARVGASTARLVAKLAGGSNMFDSKGPFQIGQQNVEAVRGQLDRFRIRLLGEHVGGTRGRRTTFNCRTGDMLVEVLGDAPVTL